MKPLKLTLSAFGNYAKEQIIDFTVLNGKNIFLITGNTGAGKTTIFDAISYGLYGSPSGDFRDTSSLRSDYVDGSIETFVELEFMIREKVYRIRRSPEQMLNKKRGEGYKKETAKVELSFLDSEEKPLTKVKEVDERINEILGVDKDQFRQIVMLPQGEFLKLLKANSKDREEIFRKIFGTEGFKRIQDKLRDKVKELWVEIKDSKSARDIYFKQIKAEDESLLKNLIENDDINAERVTELTLELIKEDEKKDKLIIEESKEIEREIKELFSKTALIDREKKVINEYFDIEKKLLVHKEKKEAVESYEEKLLKGKKAEKIKVIENNYLESLGRKNIREKEIEKLSIEKNNFKKLALEKEKELDVAKDRGKEKETLILKIEDLKKKEKLVSSYMEKKSLVEKLSLDVIRKEKTLAKLKVEEKEGEKLIKEIIDQINKSIEAKGKAELIKVSGEKHREDINKLKSLKDNYEHIRSKNEEFNKKKEHFEKIDSVYKKLKVDFEKAEEVFKLGQAGILAEGLIEGEECPVCGSKNHPKKASKASEILSEKDLKKLKDDYEKEKVYREKELTELTVLNKSIENYRKDVIEKAVNDLREILEEDFITKYTEMQQIKYIINEGLKLKKIIDEEIGEYNKLKSFFVDRDVKEKDRLTLENNLKEIKLAIEELNNNSKILSSELAVEKESLKTIELEVPLELREELVIKKEIDKLQRTINEIEKAINEKEIEFKNFSNKVIELESTLELYSKEILQLKEAIEEKLKEFKEAIILEGFEEESYKESKEIKNLEVIEEKIKGYYENLKALEFLFIDKKKALDELDVKELIEIEEKEIKLKEELIELELLEKNKKQLSNLLNNRISHNKAMIKNVANVGNKIGEKEKIYEKLSHLSNVANGDRGNLKKVTFESYVLTSYFDEIIIRANYRLDKMTNGRFLLKRKEELGKGNKKQGLDLEVYDNNTGKERGINSLSGGESFKTALCLALGLADVIQNYAGGISIDTMFVDEGFGTLDPQSLDSAIECLVNIQQGGRLVGIISHVDELKERIEAKLQVTVKDGEGSTAKFTVR
ncbi:MAG: AAA family ATPase [Sarcina sp.]